MPTGLPAAQDPQSRPQSGSLLARRSDAFDAQLTSVAAVTDSFLPDLRTHSATDRDGDGPQRPGRYLPSAQVLGELATLGPALARLADDLRERLSATSEELSDLASRPA